MGKNKDKLYIERIKETGSISQAAEQLGISQPALSAYLKKLERELGSEIFDRRRQPLKLTKAGLIYLDFLEKNEALKENLQENLLNIK